MIAGKNEEITVARQHLRRAAEELVIRSASQSSGRNCHATMKQAPHEVADLFDAFPMRSMIAVLLALIRYVARRPRLNAASSVALLLSEHTNGIESVCFAAAQCAIASRGSRTPAVEARSCPASTPIEQGWRQLLLLLSVEAQLENEIALDVDDHAAICTSPQWTASGNPIACTNSGSVEASPVTSNIHDKHDRLESPDVDIRDVSSERLRILREVYLGRNRSDRLRIPSRILPEPDLVARNNDEVRRIEGAKETGNHLLRPFGVGLRIPAHTDERGQLPGLAVHDEISAHIRATAYSSFFLLAKPIRRASSSASAESRFDPRRNG